MANKYTVRANNMFAAFVDGERTAREDDRIDRAAAADLEAKMIANEFSRAQAPDLIENQKLVNRQVQANTSAILGAEARAGDIHRSGANARAAAAYDAGLTLNFLQENGDTLIGYKKLEADAVAAQNRATLLAYQDSIKQYTQANLAISNNRSILTNPLYGPGVSQAEQNPMMSPVNFTAGLEPAPAEASGNPQQNLRSKLADEFSLREQRKIENASALKNPASGSWAGYTQDDLLLGSDIINGASVRDDGALVTSIGMVVPKTIAGDAGGIINLRKEIPGAIGDNAVIAGIQGNMRPVIMDIAAEQRAIRNAGGRNLIMAGDMLRNAGVDSNTLQEGLRSVKYNGYAEITTPTGDRLYLYKSKTLPTDENIFVSTYLPETAKGKPLR